VILLVGPDGRSVRAFDGTLDGRRLALFVKLDVSLRPAAAAGTAAASASPPPQAPRWIDDATGSEWSFAGQAVAGPSRGRQLRALPALKDYWFDWRTYHPRTSVYGGGRRSGA
jgi:hypothetical protein